MSPEPFTSRLELTAQTDAVRWARRHTRDVLSAWQVPSNHVDTAALAVSELVTNAVRHVVKSMLGRWTRSVGADPAAPRYAPDRRGI